MTNLPESYHTKLLTITDASRFLGVSTKTLRRWEMAGILAASRTDGGHRRYELARLVEFKRRTNRPSLQRASTVSPASAASVFVKKQTDSPQAQATIAPAKSVAMSSEMPSIANSWQVVKRGFLAMLAVPVLAAFFILGLNTVSANISSIRTTKSSLLSVFDAVRPGQSNVDEVSRNVLAASDILQDLTFEVNVPTNLRNVVTIFDDLVFEGGNVDDNQTTIQADEPTADRVITVPDASGEISLLGQDIDLASEVTGVLPVAAGGTGGATFAANGVLYGGGGAAINATDAGVAGELLIAGADGVPLFVGLSGDATLSSAGAISISDNAIDNAELANSITYDGTLNLTGTFQIDGTTVDASATELDYLDGTTVTAGGVIFADGTKLTQDNANFFFDNTNDRLGLGTISPNEALDIRGRAFISDGTAPAPTTNRLYAVSGNLFWNGIQLGTSGVFTDGGSVVYLTDTADDFAIGGTDGEAALFLDVSASALNLNPFGASAGNTGEIRFQELEAGGDEYTGFKAPDALGGNVIYTLPTADATGANQVLASNSSGVLSWIDVSAGAGAFWSRSGSTLSPVNSGDGVSAGDLSLGLNDATATLTTEDTNEDLTIDPNGSGDVFFHGSTYMISDTGDLTLGGRATFENGEYIANETDDIFAFVGAGGGDDTDLYIDLDGANPLIYSNTDSIVGIDDSIQVTGQSDLEGYVSIGNGSALDIDETLIVNRAFTATAGNSAYQLRLAGNITENSSGTHTTIAPLAIDAITITDGGGSEAITNLASLYIAGAPTAGTTPTNGPYSIFVDTGSVRFDGNTVLNTVDYAWPSSDASTANQVLASNSSGTLSWIDVSAGAGSNWTDGGAIVYLTIQTRDLAVGGTDAESELFFDTSASALNLNPFGASAGNTGEIRFQELEANGDHYTGFKAGDALAGDVVYTLPLADATSANQVLASNSTGTLSWIDVSAGSGSLWSQTSGVLSPSTITDDLAIGGTTSAADFFVADNGKLTFNPSTTGTYIDFNLETEWTTGSLINVDFVSVTALTGDVVALDLDFWSSTNVTGLADGDVTGAYIQTPQLTSSGTTTTDYYGFRAGGGALDTTAAEALVTDINWYGGYIQIPNIDTGEGGDTTSAYGLAIFPGTVTNGSGIENEWGILVDASSGDIVGGDASGDDLLLVSTTNATRGDIQFHSNSYLVNSTGDFTIGGRITFENAEYIQNESDDLIAFFGSGGTVDTDIFFDLDDANHPVIYSNSDAAIRIDDDLYVADSALPTIRWDKTGATAQIWEIIADDANFSVRDVTNGNLLPLQIAPGAPTNSLVVDATGDVGIGDITPDARLEVLSTAEQLRLTETDDTNDARFTVDSGGDLTINLSGGQLRLADTDVFNIGGVTALAYNALSNSGGSAGGANVTSDNDLYIQGDLEVDGVLYLDGGQANLTVATDIDIIDNSATALTVSEGSNNYLVVNTDNTNTAVTLDLPVAGSSSTTGNLFTSNAAKTINIGTGTAADAINIGTGGTGADTIIMGNVGVATTFDFNSGAATVNAFDFALNAVTTANAFDLSVDGLTTGKGINLQSTTTSTSFSGDLAYFEWAPGSATSASGDLFQINIGTNGSTTGKLFRITDTGSDLFAVDESKITSALPHEFTAAGDVSIAYDIQFTNQTAATIKSDGPLTIQSGETFESLNLKLETFNSGDIVFETAAGAIIAAGPLSVDVQATLSVDDTTPDVSTSSHYITANTGSTLISAFDGGHTGQIIFVEHGDANTDYDCTASSLNCGSTDITTTASGDASAWIYNGTTWNLITFMDDSDNHETGSGFDLAEFFPSSEPLEAGEVVAIDGTNPVSVKKAGASDGQSVIGVISTQPGITLGQEGENSHKVALAGRVPVKIDPNSEAIQIGDLIGASPTLGRAQKVAGGYIVGRALENWTPESGQDALTIFVNPIYAPAEHTEEGGLAEKIASLEDQVALLSVATGSGEIVESISATDLSVLGDSVLGDVVITGQLSVGSLNIDGIDNSIDAIGTLKIQPLALGDIEFMGGLIAFDTEGNILANEISAQKFNVLGESAGSGVLLTGAREVFVESTQVTAESLTFVTPKTTIAFPLIVTEKVDGEGFWVEMAVLAREDIEFDWFIVDKK